MSDTRVVQAGSSLATNPLQTRADLQQAFRQLSGPLKRHYSPGGARLKLGITGVHYGSETAEMEGFSRVLWGMVPLLAGGGADDELWEICLSGIRNGTDPQHPEYWGKVADYDQRLVEMAAFGFALSLIPERIWGPLSTREQDNLYQWLNQMNSHPCYDCNWLFFNVLVNMGFRKSGLDYDAGQLERNLQRLDDFYVSDGWYSDGVGGHMDYYVPFAFHYYGLLYAKLMGGEDPDRAKLYRERAVTFASSFIHWFAPDGSALPYGRSLAYRFAQCAFWGALAYAEVEALPAGVLKGLVLRNLRWWFRQGILDGEGLLTIGYAYPNLVMAENYNSPGSPYWSFKAFLPLALPETHPFWQAEELPLPDLPACFEQKPAHLVICRQPETGHVAAFNSGHPQTNEHTHTSAKYEKFVYSTAFGFSVPRSEWGLGQGAFDSMLALSEAGDNLYRVKRTSEDSWTRENVLFARWKPWSDVEVQTWIAAGLPWHIRIHRVETARALEAAEGGFALSLAADTLELAPAGQLTAAASCPQGRSEVRGLHGYGQAVLVRPHTNTNVLQPRTVIPTLLATLLPGTHWLISAVCGQPGTAEDAAAGDPQVNPAEQLGVIITEHQITVSTSGGQEIVIPID
ncbi:DUF2264 domain-containing protein [Paenibacillus donghaensis]|uniref:DUF2264 domain-containing protein n=1 Tax=Paenibacillus donghaensis TaxID=414771 RepID=A0A2Z2KP15_9BACL|nr:DUF2264 domain-containing protein [Paenibacillus donghaensis]ASA23002.1 hypothetical protein B9T62_20645 [Paenibacillus donghaensis]